MNSDKGLPMWTIGNSGYVVNDRFLKLRADSCTTPEGDKVGPHYVLELSDWVNCIAIDKDDNVMILRHYRHGIRKYLMEFVGGAIEKNESPEMAAKRELEEETGYTGGFFYHVGTSYPNPANHTNQVYTFLAIDGKVTQAQRLEIGETIHVEKVPLKTVIEEMSKPNTVYSAIYMAALFHAMNYIRTSDDPRLERLKKYV